MHKKCWMEIQNLYQENKECDGKAFIKYISQKTWNIALSKEVERKQVV